MVKSTTATTTEVKFETCNGGTDQLWNLITTGGKNQWQNKDTQTCLQGMCYFFYIFFAISITINMLSSLSNTDLLILIFILLLPKLIIDSTAGEQFTLGICSAAAVPAQTFTKNVLVAPKLTPILCGGPCDNDASGLCGFDITQVDWCGDTGSGFENTKVSIVPWCKSLAGQVCVCIYIYL